MCLPVSSSSLLLHTQAQQASTSAPSRGSQPGRETDVKEGQWFPPSCEEQQVHSQDLAGWLGVQLGAIASATGIQTFSTVLVHNHHSSKMLDIILSHFSLIPSSAHAAFRRLQSGKVVRAWEEPGNEAMSCASHNGSLARKYPTAGLEHVMALALRENFA